MEGLQNIRDTVHLQCGGRVDVLHVLRVLQLYHLFRSEMRCFFFDFGIVSCFVLDDFIMGEVNAQAKIVVV